MFKLKSHKENQNTFYTYFS